MIISDEGATALIAAIREKARKDYIRSVRIIAKLSKKENLTIEEFKKLSKAEKRKYDCERYFNSGKFMIVTNAGDSIIRELNRMVINHK